MNFEERANIIDNLKPNHRESIQEKKSYFDRGKGDKNFEDRDEDWMNNENKMKQRWKAVVIVRRTYLAVVGDVHKRKHVDKETYKG